MIAMVTQRRFAQAWLTSSARPAGGIPHSQPGTSVGPTHVACKPQRRFAQTLLTSSSSLASGVPEGDTEGLVMLTNVLITQIRLIVVRMPSKLRQAAFGTQLPQNAIPGHVTKPVILVTARPTVQPTQPRGRLLGSNLAMINQLAL